jgi:predicted porin
MNRILSAAFLYIVASAPAYASYTPFYGGFQLDNDSGSALLGYQIGKKFAVEAQANRSETHIDQAGATSVTKSTAFGVTGLFLFPMQLTGGSPYLLFAKAGYEHIKKNVSYNFPPSVTLSVALSGSYKNVENRAIVGVGAQYDFYQNMNGRVGVDIEDNNRSVYLGLIFRF